MSGAVRSVAGQFDLPLAGRSMELDLRSFQRATPAEGDLAPLATCDIVFSAGARVKRYDWWRERDYFEELVVEDGAIRLERLQRGAPLLNAHSAYRLEDQLGVVENPMINGGRGTVRATFSRRESVAGYVQDVADGVIRNVSTGYIRHRIEMVPPEEDGGTWVYRVVDWEPMEVSLVPVPADMDSQVVRAAGNQSQAHDGQELRSFPCEFIEVRSANAMSPIRGGGAAATVPVPADPAAGFSRSLSGSNMPSIITTAARDEINLLCRQHRVPDLAASLIERGATVEQARAAVLEELVRRDQAAGGHLNVRNVQPGAGERDRILNSLIVRMGGRVDGETIASTDCVGLAVRALELGGHRVHDRDSRDAILQRALHTSSDFPHLLNAAAGRVLHQGYAEAPAALKQIARQSNVPDFRDKMTVRLGPASALEKVNEHGEFKYGTVEDAGNSWAVSTYGRIIGVTRKVLINDDLNGIGTLLAKFGQSAARREADELTKILVTPSNVDGAALFSSGRSSLITKVLGLAGLELAVKALRLQKDLDGGLLNQEPAYLVVPAALETVARQLVAQFVPVAAGNVQPYRLTVVVEPRLDATSSTAWYLVAGSQSAMEYGYLDGAEGVQTFQREGFEVDGLEIKARLDFGCGWVAPVGWVKSTGADA